MTKEPKPMHGVFAQDCEVAMYWCPKNACTLLRQLFYHLHGDELEGEKKGYLWHQISKDFPRPPTKSVQGFMLCRHPYLRAISMYTNALLQQNHVTEWEKLMDPDCPKSFRNFCIFLCKLKDAQLLESCDIHYRPQTANVTTLFADGSTIDWERTRLMRMETAPLEAQMRETYRELLGEERYRAYEPKMNQFFGVQHPSTKTWRSSNQHCDACDVAFTGSPFPSYESFVDDALIGIIEDIYSQDYRELGYEFGKEALLQAIADYKEASSSR